MGCFDDYITISGTSRSGLTVIQLPGVTEDVITELIPNGMSTVDEFWEEKLYPRAVSNLVSDVSKELQDRFHLDYKLVSRETSKILSTLNENTGLAGLKITFDLPRYAKIHVKSIEVWSNDTTGSPDATIEFYDTDEDGELLYFKDANLIPGRNVINIDRDFEVDALFIAYDPELITLRKTENKYYPNCEYWDEIVCDYWCFNRKGSFRQVNGGGLNVTYNVHCSVEKLVCQNINLFRHAFWWKLGVEVMVERRIGCTINQYTTMPPERAEELFNFFGAQYEKELLNAVKSQSIREDEICFSCKNLVEVKSSLP